VAVFKYGHVLTHFCAVIAFIVAWIMFCMTLATVNTIGLAKPEKAKMVESMLIQMAQTGQIQGKVTEHLL